MNALDIKQKKKDPQALIPLAPVYVAGWFCGKISRFLDAIAVGGITTAGALKNKPSIQATLHSLKMKKETGAAEILTEVEEINRAADAIIDLFSSKGISPTRLAIDGVPGSGKSTLALALAKRMGFQCKALDYIDIDKPQDFSEQKMIYEHHRLFRTQEIDHFDAIIYIDEPIEICKEICLNRKRDAVNIDIFNYEKLKKIGEKAFAMASGKIYRIPDSHFKLKIRPRSGYKAYDKICDEVKAKGFAVKRRSLEELLFLSVYGKAKGGLSSYIKLSAYNHEFKKGLKAGIARFLMP